MWIIVRKQTLPPHVMMIDSYGVHVRLPICLRIYVHLNTRMSLYLSHVYVLPLQAMYGWAMSICVIRCLGFLIATQVL